MAMHLTKARARDQIAALATWERFMGFPEHSAITYGAAKLGMNWKTYWRYRHGTNYMPTYIRHAMQNLAQGMPAWGETQD